MQTGMTTVREILDKKGYNIWSVTPTDTVREALLLMAQRNCGALVCIDEGRLAGIISERDYARKVMLQGKSSRDTLVQDVMTRIVSYVVPQHTVSDCMALMTTKHIRHLPVVENGEVVGLVSIGDIVKELISEQEFMLQQMENYIVGAR